MNSESLTNVLTRQWRIVTGNKTVNPRNRMPATGASGSVGSPLEESGALPGKGLLPTSWAPPIYSVSLLTKLRCALGGNGILRPTAVRSFLARICQTQNPTKTMKKSEITRQGLDDVGFIGFENRPTTGLDQINDNDDREPLTVIRF